MCVCVCGRSRRGVGGTGDMVRFLVEGEREG
jgi:hypothetical protein